MTAWAVPASAPAWSPSSARTARYGPARSDIWFVKTSTCPWVKNFSNLSTRRWGGKSPRFGSAPRTATRRRQGPSPATSSPSRRPPKASRTSCSPRAKTQWRRGRWIRFTGTPSRAEASRNSRVISPRSFERRMRARGTCSACSVRSRRSARAEGRVTTAPGSVTAPRVISGRLASTRTAQTTATATVGATLSPASATATTTTRTTSCWVASSVSCTWRRRRARMRRWTRGWTPAAEGSRRSTSPA